MHAKLSSAGPAASLREAVALLRLAPPSGLREIDWYLNDTQVVAPTITPDDATRLEAVASWLDKNPGVVSYALSADGPATIWGLTTTTEVPDAVRDFATVAGAGGTVKVSGSLAGKPPYVTLP
jgi:hypothetical protein